MIVTPYSSLGLHATYAELCPSAVQLDRFIPSRSALDVGRLKLQSSQGERHGC